MAVLGKDKTIIRDTLDRIKEKITDEKIVNLFFDTVADREISKRAAALATLWETILKQEVEVKKVKPDLQKYGEDEKLIEEYFSKNQMEVLKKSRERLDRMSKAFEKGLAGDMKDVYDLNNQSGKDKGGSGKENSGESG